MQGKTKGIVIMVMLLWCIIIIKVDFGGKNEEKMPPNVEVNWEVKLQQTLPAFLDLLSE